MGKIIAVVNQKGGVGKTTTAVNLAAAVGAAEQRVLLVDLDPQGNATSGFGIPKKNEGASVYDLLIGDAKIRDVIRHTPYQVNVIPAGIQLAGAEIEMVELPRRESRLKAALAEVREDYDYLFIDCPPSLGLLTLNGLCAADTVLVPIQCEYYALEGVGQLMNTVKLVRRKLNPDLRIEGIALTMYDARTNLSAQVVQEVREHFPEEAFETLIPRNVRLSEAPSYALPISEYDPRCAGAAAYQDLAKELIRRADRR